MRSDLRGPRRSGRAALGVIATLALAGIMVLGLPAWSTHPGGRVASPEWPMRPLPSDAHTVVRDPDTAMAVSRTRMSGGVEIALVRADGDGEQVLFTDATAARIQGLTWSMAGRYLAFELARRSDRAGPVDPSSAPGDDETLDWELHVIDTHTGADRIARSGLERYSDPTWTTDDTLTYSVRKRGGELWQGTFERRAADGTQLEPLRLDPERVAYRMVPAPGGAHGYYRSIDRNDVGVQRLAGFDVADWETATLFEGSFTQGRWSPDGQLLAFESDLGERQGAYRIVVLDPFEGAITSLTVPGAMGECNRSCTVPGPVAWSADGRRLLGTATDDGHSFLASLSLGVGEVDFYRSPVLWKWLETEPHDLEQVDGPLDSSVVLTDGEASAEGGDMTQTLTLLVGADGMTVQDLSSVLGAGSVPVEVSPDGSWLAYRNAGRAALLDLMDLSSHQSAGPEIVSSSAWRPPG